MAELFSISIVLYRKQIGGFDMTLSDACKIDLASFNKIPALNEICMYIERNELCSAHHILTFHDDIVKYVKMADFAYESCRQVWGTPTIEFVLQFMCGKHGKVPFDLYNEVSDEIRKHYNFSTSGMHSIVDEELAMAAVLMVTIGYEIRKLAIVRNQVSAHQQKIKNCAVSVPQRRLALPEEYAKFHIDMVDVYEGIPLTGYQFERYSQYFELVNGKRPLSQVSARMQRLIEDNVSASSSFVSTYGSNSHLTQVTYDTRPGRVSVRPYGFFDFDCLKQVG